MCLNHRKGQRYLVYMEVIMCGVDSTPVFSWIILKVISIIHIHQAFIEVNEEGTGAAAATAVVMKATAILE